MGTSGLKSGKPEDIRAYVDKLLAESPKAERKALANIKRLKRKILTKNGVLPSEVV